MRSNPMNRFRKPDRILRVLVALTVLYAVGASADPPASQNAPAASPPAAGKESAGASASKDAASNGDKSADKDSDKEQSGAKAPKRFVPSERSPADSNSTFPVDI